MKTPNTRRVGKTSYGFTIVELLIVVVVIGILAAITIVSYNGIQSRAYTSKVQADFATLQKAITAAREATGKTLTSITSNGYSAANCRNGSITDGTNLAALGESHTCWVTYKNTLSQISTASGVDVRNLVDPWGWPYHIDENEGENGGCSRDTIGVFGRPLNAYAAGPHDSLPVTDPTYALLSVPRSGFSGCAAG